MPSEIHRRKSHLYTVTDLREYKPPPTQRIIADGVLEVGSRMMLFGDEGSWKSGLAIHAGYCIATGRKFLGFKTTPSNVLYVQSEMNIAQTKIRSEKYCAGTKKIFLADSRNLPPNPTPEQFDMLERNANLISYPENMVMQSSVFLHMDESSGFEKIKKDIEEMIVGYPNLPFVLILDPLYKMFRHDLIKEEDAKYFTDNMDLLLADKRLWENRPGMAVIVVHHARKPGLDKNGNVVRAGSDEMYGSAEFKWFPDTILSTTLDEDDETKTSIDLRFTKVPRIGDTLVPKLIKMKWNKDLYHPRITARVMPREPEDGTDTRGALDIAEYE